MRRCLLLGLVIAWQSRAHTSGASPTSETSLRPAKWPASFCFHVRGTHRLQSSVPLLTAIDCLTVATHSLSSSASPANHQHPFSGGRQRQWCLAMRNFEAVDFEPESLAVSQQPKLRGNSRMSSRTSFERQKKKRGTSAVPFSRWSPRVLSYRRAASTITSSEV